jgi:hypothetical protein
MKVIAMKLNPAFKRTQLLPVLTADLAGRTGRAAQSIAQGFPLARVWPAVAVSAVSAANRMMNANSKLQAAV